MKRTIVLLAFMMPLLSFAQEWNTVKTTIIFKKPILTINKTVIDGKEINYGIRYDDMRYIYSRRPVSIVFSQEDMRQFYNSLRLIVNDTSGNDLQIKANRYVYLYREHTKRGFYVHLVAIDDSRTLLGDELIFKMIDVLEKEFN